MGKAERPKRSGANESSFYVLNLSTADFRFQPAPVPEPVHPQYDRHQKINPAAPLDLLGGQSKGKDQRHEPDAYRDAPARKLAARHQLFPRIQSQRLTQLPSTKIEEQ